MLKVASRIEMSLKLQQQLSLHWRLGRVYPETQSRGKAQDLSLAHYEACPPPSEDRIPSEHFAFVGVRPLGTCRKSGPEW